MIIGFTRSLQVVLSLSALTVAGPALAALSAPASLTATAASSSAITLKWVDMATTESGYSIERSSSSTSGFVVIATTAKNVISYQDSGIAPATTRYYRVRTMGRKATFSPYSNVAAATTVGNNPTATSSATATRTNTPIPPTATPSNTSAPTNTLLPLTATRTNTPLPMNTATSVPTNTPIPPTATLTHTPMPPPTNTQVPTTTPTSTPTPTAIPATDGGSYLWSQHFGGTTADVGEVVTTDPAGNMLVAGFFTGTVNLGGGSITSAGTDIFLAKYSPTGQYLWAIHTGNAGSNSALGVAADSNGNVVITGQFQNTLNFGCGSLSSALASSYDIFVAKYSATGTCQWSKSFGSGNDDSGYGVAVDASNNVIVTGVFVGRVSFGGTALYSSNSSSGNSTFVAKYAPDGTHVWSKSFSPTTSNNGPDAGYAVAVDGSGNVLVTGSFQGTEYFDGVTGITSSGLSEDIYVAKLAAANGSYQWVRSFGNTGSDRGYGVAVDGSGNVVITGYFAGSVGFGGGVPLTSAGPMNVFLARYSPAGAYEWAQAFTGTGVNTGYGVAVDGSNNVIVTGSFQTTTNFGGALLTSLGRSDIFVAKYSPAGGVLWAHRYGSTSDDIGYRVAADGSGNAVATGYFAGSVSFGGSSLSSAGSVDIYVVKLAP